MYNYIIKYSWEIWIKSKNVRFGFIEKLTHNIKKAAGEDFVEIKKSFDLIRLTTANPIWEKLAKIPGIAYFSEVFEYNFKDIDDIIEKWVEFFKDSVKWKKFALKCKRRWNHSFTSVDVADGIRRPLRDFGKIDLNNPEITFDVEIKDSKLFLLQEKITGLWWLPMWVGWKTMLLFSGWIDSAVVAFMLYKSWLDVEFLYFDLWWKEPLKCAINSAKHLKENYGLGSRSRFTCIDFLDIVAEILKWNKTLLNLLLKYCFYTVAGKLQDKSSADALATGESVNQVSTQTLKNLIALDSFSDKLILRPVIAMPKMDIIKIAYEIWTFNLAYKWKEFCALATKWVETAVKKEDLLDEINKLDLLPLIEKAIEKRQIIKLDEITDVWAFVDEFMKDSSISCSLPNSHENKNLEVIIDLREKEDFKLFNIPWSINIPYEIAFTDYVNWDKTKRYFLVCEEGRLGKILAKKMKEEGFEVKYEENGMMT